MTTFTKIWCDKEVVTWKSKITNTNSFENSFFQIQRQKVMLKEQNDCQKLLKKPIILTLFVENL